MLFVYYNLTLKTVCLHLCIHIMIPELLKVYEYLSIFYAGIGSVAQIREFEKESQSSLVLMHVFGITALKQVHIHVCFYVLTVTHGVTLVIFYILQDYL